MARVCRTTTFGSACEAPDVTRPSCLSSSSCRSPHSPSHSSLSLVKAAAASSSSSSSVRYFRPSRADLNPLWHRSLTGCTERHQGRCEPPVNSLKTLRLALRRPGDELPDPDAKATRQGANTSSANHCVPMTGPPRGRSCPRASAEGLRKGVWSVSLIVTPRAERILARRPALETRGSTDVSK